MDTFGTSDLGRLTGGQEGPCVSVYLPTHVAGEQAQQDPVRLKNLLQQAEKQLSDDWMRGAEARKLLQQARDLPIDNAFWDERSHGLAIFAAPKFFYRYRLPVRFDELVMVNRRFHIKPLLSLLTGGDRFFLLALSQNKVRLFAASRYAIEQIDVSGIPTNMKEALNYAGSDRGSQVHSAMHGSLGKQAAVFHGQGGVSDTRKDDLSQFFRMIDSALQPVLREEQTPLMLSGVEYLLPIYREVTSYPHIVEQELEGNCDYLTAYQLREKAWPLIESEFKHARENAAARFRQLAGTGKTSDDIKQIVRDAHEGRIDTLFVDADAHQWGVFDTQAGEVRLHEDFQTGDDDLFDLAAVQTLTSRGTVYSVQREQIPSNEPVAAMLRY